MGKLSLNGDKDLRETCACLKSLSWEFELLTLKSWVVRAGHNGLGEAI